MLYYYVIILYLAFLMIISPIIMYMIFLLNSSISVIEYIIQAISLICMFYSCHVHIVLIFFVTSCVTDDHQ